MIIDAHLEIANAANLNTATGTNNLTNVIDLGTNPLNTLRDVGNGEPVYLVVQASADITSGGTATLQFQLVSDSQAPPRTDGNQVVHAMSRPVTVPAVANSTVGTKAGSLFWVLPLPQAVDYKQYLTVQQVVGTAVLTGGKVNASLQTNCPAEWKAFSDFS